MVGLGRDDIHGTRAVGGNQTRRPLTTAGLGYLLELKLEIWGGRVWYCHCMRLYQLDSSVRPLGL